MKLRALRIDLDDIIHLMVASDIKDPTELADIAKTFYPEKEFGGKLYTSLNDLCGEYLEAKERLKDDPPRYIG